MYDRVKSVHWLWRLQSDCGDCTMIADIAVWLLRLQSDCWDCSLIVNIAVWLWGLHNDCWDCSLIAEIAVLNSALGAWHTLECGPLYVRHGKICSLIVEIAVWLLRLQSDCWDCSLIAEIAKVPQLTYTCPNPPQGVRLQSPQWNCNLYNQTAMHEDCSLNAEIAVWLLILQSDCWDCKSSATYLYMSRRPTKGQACC